MPSARREGLTEDKLRMRPSILEIIYWEKTSISSSLISDDSRIKSTRSSSDSISFWIFTGMISSTILFVLNTAVKTFRFATQMPVIPVLCYNAYKSDR